MMTNFHPRSFVRRSAASIPVLALLVLLAAPMAAAHAGLAGNLADAVPPAPGRSEAAPSAATLALLQEPTRRVGVDATYNLRFQCPKIPLPGPVVNQEVARGRCPADVLDTADVMSSPILLVDPRSPYYFAFNALHGGRGTHVPGSEPPSNESRDNYLHQPHTTFYSADGRGEVWNDNPYYSPLFQPPNRNNAEEPGAFVPTGTQLAGRQVFGEDNAATVDAQGRIYLASLYSYRDTRDGPFQYAIGLWKAQRMQQPVDYYSGNSVMKFPAGVSIDSVFAVYVPGTDRVAVVWLEHNKTAPLRDYVNIAWTVPGKGAIWNTIRASERIGPCSGITNPLAHAGRIYIGCFADPGYPVPQATLGRLQMHAVDASTWTQSRIDETTIDRGASRPQAILFDRTEGRMGIASAGLQTNGRVFLKVAYGVEGGAWDPADNFGAQIDQQVVRPPGVAAVIESQVNAAGFLLRSGNVHLIYQERYEFADGQRPPSASAEFFKALISVHSGAEHTFNKMLPLGTDDKDPENAQAEQSASPCQAFDVRYAPTTGVFKDLHDSIVIWQGPGNEQREFIAYGDCGHVRFAEVKEDNAILFAFPAPPGTPPIPSPMAGVNPAQVGVVAGALAGAMVLRMLAFKRKLAVEAPA